MNQLCSVFYSIFLSSNMNPDNKVNSIYTVTINSTNDTSTPTNINTQSLYLNFINKLQSAQYVYHLENIDDDRTMKLIMVNYAFSINHYY